MTLEVMHLTVPHALKLDIFLKLTTKQDQLKTIFSTQPTSHTRFSHGSLDLRKLPILILAGIM